jgi:hypothetical protein
MERTKNTYLLPLIIVLLLSFMAQLNNQGISIHIDSQVADQYEIELLLEKDGESDPILHPSIIDAILSIVFNPHIKEEFRDLRTYCLDNPLSHPLKVPRIILFRSLKIHTT